MPLFESAIGGTAVSIVETAVKAGKYAAKEVREAYTDVERVQQLIAASEAYLENYRHRHCQIKILPGLMNEPLDLEAIYTDVKILDDISRRAFIGPEALEAAYREKGSRYFGNSTAERLNGMTVANDKQCLMVLGGPGIGKSTFLRKIGLEALKKEGALTNECIPVFLELKKFREGTIDIQTKIVEEFDICKFPDAAAFVEAALAQGKLLVLFDGLDEVPSDNLNQVIEKIENFVDQHSQKLPGTDQQNCFVTSCRLAAYRSSFRSFTDVTISEFDDEQIKQFIDRWFGTEEDKALGTGDKYLALLNQKEHRATKELAQTPLLLTFLCLVYDREQMIPNERSTLYGSALNIVLKEWAAQKRIEQEPIYKGFHPALEQIMLAEIAYDSFQKGQLFFSKEMITAQITDFLTDMLEAPKQLNADAVLEAIEVQQGILVERATDAYSFSHLTLQEYLTALHIVDKRLEDDLVTQHVTDDSWGEVFLLVAGLMKNNVMILLLAIDRQARTHIASHPKLQALVKWAEVNRVGPSLLCQRAASLMIASNSDSNSDIAKAIASDIASDIARATASAKAMASNSDPAIDIASAKAIASNSDIAIDIDIVSAKAIASDIVSAITIASDIASDIVSDITRASDIARAITSTSDSESNHHFFQAETFNSITTHLTKHQQSIPKVSDSLKTWRTWAEKLNLIWLEALELDQDAITLSRQEAIDWKHYMYANKLLLKCKQAAIRIPRVEWEKLENRLLTFDES